MATKPNFVNAGYDNSLQFDPASGIIKYGAYEFFADQVGNKSSTSKFTFDDYRRSLEPQTSPSYNFWGSSQRLYSPPKPLPALDPATEGKLRADFVAAAQARAVGDAGGMRTVQSQPRQIGMSMSGPIMDNSPMAFGSMNRSYEALPSVTKVNQVDDNTFEISTYEVPKDIDFVNRLNERAKNLNANVELGQVSDANRPAGGTARLGKPNYSRAATVLAGESAPLGGAKTTLGA